MEGLGDNPVWIVSFLNSKLNIKSAIIRGDIKKREKKRNKEKI